MSNKLQVRVVSPWFCQLETDDAFFSTKIQTDNADALLCVWAPSSELFTFPRRKAWYCCEPRRHFTYLQGKRWLSIRDRLKPEEFLWHGHSDERFRVPHITHNGSLAVIDRNADRIDRAVAVVSNYGGQPLRRSRDTKYRNRFVLTPGVDLYGRSAAWQKYKAHLLSRPRLPENFKNDIPGDWDAIEKVQLLARYKVCVCLENSFEPNYFTEKFVDAVMAGCIPVYRAHPSVAETFLKGAKWIDPGQGRTKCEKIISKALDASLRDYHEMNAAWLHQSKRLNQTSGWAVFSRISRILSRAETVFGEIHDDAEEY